MKRITKTLIFAMAATVATGYIFSENLKRIFSKRKKYIPKDYGEPERFYPPEFFEWMEYIGETIYNDFRKKIQ